MIEDFTRDGFVRLDEAVPADLVAAVRARLWQESGCSPDDPSTWTKPVVRLGDYYGPPFREAANTPTLVAAYDALVGVGKWLPRYGLGSFPLRFPSTESPGDDGWHVDAGFAGKDAATYFDWRINRASRGRALLMLFLFSDVGVDDAPTRLRVGSHHDVAALLDAYGDEGLSFMELASRLDALPAREVAFATGRAGTVYLCHPFLVHAAQPHRGTVPRFMAQPPLLPSGS